MARQFIYHMQGLTKAYGVPLLITDSTASHWCYFCLVFCAFVLA